MTAVKAGDVERTLNRLDPRIGVLLFYGPDAGLVGERARRTARAAVADPDDPFQLVRLDGDAVAGDPGRLAEEAGTIGLFGARRALWVRPTSRNLAPAVEAVLAVPAGDTLVVVEAGDLAKGSPLRIACERAPRALALPCYSDADRDLGALVDVTLREAGLTIAPDARTLLVDNLGADRLASRAELDKLVLYAAGQGRVTVEDVEAVVSDASQFALDAVTDAAFLGDRADLELGLRRLQAERVTASAILGAALRHALALLPARLEVERGRRPPQVVEAWRGLHFRRRPAVERQLGLWTHERLRAAVNGLNTTLLASRKHPELGAALAAQSLLDLAPPRSARR